MKTRRESRHFEKRRKRRSIHNYQIVRKILSKLILQLLYFVTERAKNQKYEEITMRTRRERADILKKERKGGIFTSRMFIVSQ
jgi:DNA-binding helix-hairpin-helix protein with protein kinase domain